MTARPAATLLLIFPHPGGGIDVLMMERSSRGFFGGLWVFPGGAVEPGDSSATAVTGGALDDFEFRAAALRETVEELGVAVTTDGVVSLRSDPDVNAQMEALGSQLDGESIRLLSQWVTPAAAPQRFEARFYLAITHAPVELHPDPGEVVTAGWVSPERALERHTSREWSMFTPTVHHLEWLSKFPEAEMAWSAAENAVVEPVEPMVEKDGSEVKVRLPGSARLP